jgi:hypothetical protein
MEESAAVREGIEQFFDRLSAGGSGDFGPVDVKARVTAVLPRRTTAGGWSTCT